MKRTHPKKAAFSKKNDKHRRSGRRDDHAKEGHFTVDSFAAIKEYLRFKPGCIQSIRVQERHQVFYERELAGFRSVFSAPLQLASAEDPAIVAEVLLLPTDFDEFLEARAHKSKHVVLALDHIEDPRNLGAIARSAAFFGVDAIIAPQDRQALLTPASVHTSMGAFALVDLVVVTNLRQSLKKLKEAGYWTVAADMNGKNIVEVVGLHDKVVLVLGAEDKGLSRLVREDADHVVSIKGAKTAVESLNVSVAAAILMDRFSEDYRALNTSQT